MILDGARNPIFEWNSSNWGVTTPNQILKHGDNYSLRVVAFDRYDFLQGWWGTEDQLDMLDYPTFFETNFIPVKDLNLFANFSFRNYKLIVQSTGSYSDITPTQIQSSLIVDANQTVVPNLVSIFVEPDVGFAFERWHDPWYTNFDIL